MKALDQVTDGLLRVAADRWPADLREVMLADWRAEIAWLRGRPGTGWRQWRYAVSLAVRRPHGLGATRRRLSPLLRSLIVLSLAGVAAAPAYLGLKRVVDRLVAVLPVNETAGQGTGYVVGSLVLALTFGLLGWATANRFPLATGERRWSDGATAAITVMAMSFWLLVTWLFSGQALLRWPVLLPTFIPLVWALVRLFRAGRTRWGWVVGVIGGWSVISTLSIVEALGVVYDFTSFVGFPVQTLPIEPWMIPLWGFGSLAHGNFGPSITISELDYTVTPLLTASFCLTFLAFAATYAVRSRRQPRPSTREVIADVPASAAPLRDRMSVGLAATGILTWATVLTVVTPRINRDLGFFTMMNQGSWHRGLRFAAIALTILAFGTLLSRRRAALIPMAGLVVGLAAMDWFVMSSGLVGMGSLLLLAGSAGALTVAVYTATMRFSRPAGGDSTGLATISITAAASAPVVMMNWIPDQPWFFMTLTVVLMYALALQTAVAVSGLIPRDRGHVRVRRIFVHPMAWLVGFPVVLTGLILLMVSWKQHALMAGVLIGPVVVLIAMAVGWKPLPTWPVAWRWFYIGTFTVAASVLLVLSNFLGLSDLVSAALPTVWDGRPMTAGATVIIPTVAAVLESRMRVGVPGNAVVDSRVHARLPATD